jgi:hypothetical protein
MKKEEIIKKIVKLKLQGKDRIKIQKLQQKLNDEDKGKGSE